MLQWQMAIQMNDNVQGSAIARLLELYMKGVEKMNSKMDKRQIYFKNKVTSLMGRANVIKSFSKSIMVKKDKPMETTAQVKQRRKDKKIDKEGFKSKIKDSSINLSNLHEKKKQIQMRVAYQVDESSPQNLKKLFKQQTIKESQINNKIQAIMNEHETRLQERINKRKLKTSTFRSKPDETNDTIIQFENQNNQAKKIIQQAFFLSLRTQAQKQNPFRNQYFSQQKYSSYYQEMNLTSNRKRRFSCNLTKKEIFVQNLRIKKINQRK